MGARSVRSPALASDLVHRQVTVIAATGGIPSALAAKAATSTIPIVFVAGSDPIKFGVVTGLSRPERNLTGLTAFTSELVPKRLELLHEVVKKDTGIALLVNPTNAVSESVQRDVQEAARTLGLQLNVLHASTEPDLDKVFATLNQLRAGALVIGTDTFFDGQSERLATLAVQHAMPAIYQTREFAAAGGLMSYGGMWQFLIADGSASLCDFQVNALWSACDQNCRPSHLDKAPRLTSVSF
jgi:putative ABC transport system substrate-binding protein